MSGKDPGELTVLASLVFIVTECTVEGGEFSELVTLELILTFGNRSSLFALSVSISRKHWKETKTYGFNDVVDQLLGLVYFLLRICHDQTVKIFFLIASVSGIRSPLSFLDGTFASNSNLGSRFLFHGLKSVSTRSDEQTNFGKARRLSVSMSVSSK